MDTHAQQVIIVTHQSQYQKSNAQLEHTEPRPKVVHSQIVFPLTQGHMQTLQGQLTSPSVVLDVQVISKLRCASVKEPIDTGLPLRTSVNV